MFDKPTLVRQDATPERRTHSLLRHPVFALMGLRPILGQHTYAEDAALREWATGRSRLVEIGVAEGASAITLRGVMSPEGSLWLIDPFHLSRVRRLNAMKRVAHRAVNEINNGRVVWINKFSFEAVKAWVDQIDFLFLDGDHSETGVQSDWDDWHQYVIPGGVVAFHDAELGATVINAIVRDNVPVRTVTGICGAIRQDSVIVSGSTVDVDRDTTSRRRV